MMMKIYNTASTRGRRGCNTLVAVLHRRVATAVCYYYFVILLCLDCIIINSLLFGSLDAVSALDNGVGILPPMGWISWLRYGCNIDCQNYPDACINSKLYYDQAHELVRGGYRDAGYVYVNIDDCWSLPDRDNVTGEIIEDPVRFPDGGLVTLGQQIHDLGLKFGLYTDIGKTTCAGYPGLNEGQYYDIDANKFANVYKIDSIKVDGCFSNTSIYNRTFPEFGAALNRTGRPILYNCKWSLSLHPNTSQQLVPIDDTTNTTMYAVAKYCNIWRDYHDVTDDWDSIRNLINYWSLRRYVYEAATGLGHYIDPDMLVIGNNGLSISQQQIQFVMWSIFAAPLHISTDLRTIRPESRDILLNRGIIAVNQDPLAKMGYCVHGCPIINTTLLPPNVDLSLYSNGFHVHRIYVREVSSWPDIPRCLGKMSSSSSSSQQQEQKQQYYSNSWVIAFVNMDNIFGLESITLDITRHLPLMVQQSLSSSTEFVVIRDLIQQRSMNETYNRYYTAMVDENSVQLYRIVLLYCAAEETSQSYSVDK